jgi:hypothetical protein
LETAAADRFFPDERALVYSFHAVDIPDGAFGTSWETADPRLTRLWHQLLYVESEAKLSQALTSPFEVDWARSRTYDRWRSSPMLYGYCHYGACVLASASFWDMAWGHWQSMYLDMTLLLMYQRAICFRASACLAKVSRDSAGGSATEPAAKRSNELDRRALFQADFAALRMKFTRFTNVYWFPILSNAVQGIEMFLTAQKQFDTKELFDEVEREIRVTDEFLRQESADRLNEGVALLTKWSVIPALLGLLVGYMSANPPMMGDEWNPCDWIWSDWMVVLSVPAVAVLGAAVWLWITTRLRRTTYTETLGKST